MLDYILVIFEGVTLTTDIIVTIVSFVPFVSFISFVFHLYISTVGEL